MLIFRTNRAITLLPVIVNYPQITRITQITFFGLRKLLGVTENVTEPERFSLAERASQSLKT
jgi:hypothetical protein